MGVRLPLHRCIGVSEKLGRMITGTRNDRLSHCPSALLALWFRCRSPGSLGASLDRSLAASTSTFVYRYQPLLTSHSSSLRGALPAPCGEYHFSRFCQRHAEVDHLSRH